MSSTASAIRSSRRRASQLAVQRSLADDAQPRVERARQKRESPQQRRLILHRRQVADVQDPERRAPLDLEGEQGRLGADRHHVIVGPREPAAGQRVELRIGHRHQRVRAAAGLDHQPPAERPPEVAVADGGDVSGLGPQQHDGGRNATGPREADHERAHGIAPKREQSVVAGREVVGEELPRHLPPAQSFEVDGVDRGVRRAQAIGGGGRKPVVDGRERVVGHLEPLRQRRDERPDRRLPLRERAAADPARRKNRQPLADHDRARGARILIGSGILRRGLPMGTVR